MSDCIYIDTATAQILHKGVVIWRKSNQTSNETGAFLYTEGELILSLHFSFSQTSIRGIGLHLNSWFCALITIFHPSFIPAQSVWAFSSLQLIWKGPEIFQSASHCEWQALTKHNNSAYYTSEIHVFVTLVWNVRGLTLKACSNYSFYKKKTSCF